MREIKFRIWEKNKDESYNHMIFDPITIGRVIWDLLRKSKTVQSWRYPLNSENYQTYNIMQYTWLKDKNWKEIYEWDILKWQSWASNNRYDFWIIPEWNDNAWAYCIHDQKYWSRGSRKDSHIADLLATWNAVYKFEIVWNIYENPDLIFKK